MKMSLVKALFSCNLQASVGPLRSWVTVWKENEDNNRISRTKRVILGLAQIGLELVVGPNI